ncbi:MAG: DNA adenine methylase [Verrucomicrobiota bacterium]
MPTKPILRWPGGKTRLLSEILPAIRPHRLYVEGFAGGLAVLLAKPRSPAEVVNDLSGDLVNLYRHAQFHLDALVAEVEWTLTSRQDLADLVNQPGLTGLQQAARFLLRNRLSFGGGGSSFAVSSQAQPSRANVLAALGAFSERLDKVAVENLPYERLMDTYDRPDAFWFLDPPYSTGKVETYGLWTPAQMDSFAARVDALEGDWLVTVNDCPHNRDLFARHEVKAVVTKSQAVNQRLKPNATFGELVIQPRKRGTQKAFKSAFKCPSKPLLKAA